VFRVFCEIKQNIAILAMKTLTLLTLLLALTTKYIVNGNNIFKLAKQ